MKGSLHTDEFMGAVVAKATACAPAGASAMPSSWIADLSGC